MKSPHIKLEKEAWGKDILVCGVDEVGRGCLAGPVVAACVVFPKGHKIIKNVRDSKKLTPKMRAEIYEKILDEASDFGIGLVPSFFIDKAGIGEATKRAMKNAICGLSSPPQSLLIDALTLEDVEVPQVGIIKGDESVYSISAASIVAKVFRDSIVSGLDNVYAGYSFSSHKGYGTKGHYLEIAEYGITEEHRKSFLKDIDYA